MHSVFICAPHLKTQYQTVYCPFKMATYSSSENAPEVITEWPINKYFLRVLPLPPLVSLARLSSVCAHMEKELVKCHRIFSSDLLTFFVASIFAIMFETT